MHPNAGNDPITFIRDLFYCTIAHRLSSFSWHPGLRHPHPVGREQVVGVLGHLVSPLPRRLRLSLSPTMRRLGQAVSTIVWPFWGKVCFVWVPSSVPNSVGRESSDQNGIPANEVQNSTQGPLWWWHLVASICGGPRKWLSVCASCSVSFLGSGCPLPISLCPSASTHQPVQGPSALRVAFSDSGPPWDAVFCPFFICFMLVAAMWCRTCIRVPTLPQT